MLRYITSFHCTKILFKHFFCTFFLWYLFRYLDALGAGAHDGVGVPSGHEAGEQLGGDGGAAAEGEGVDGFGNHAAEGRAHHRARHLQQRPGHYLSHVIHNPIQPQERSYTKKFTQRCR